MATRFAGDFFGIPLTTPDEDKSSNLLKYFPELKSIRNSSSPATGAPLGEARSFGGAQAVSPFVGFKTFEVTNQKKAAPMFAGFKTLEQPTRASSVSSNGLEAQDKKEVQYSSIDPEVLKTLGIS